MRDFTTKQGSGFRFYPKTKTFQAIKRRENGTWFEVGAPEPYRRPLAAVLAASRSSPVPAWFVVLDNIRHEDSEVYDAVLIAIEHGRSLS